MYYQFDHVRLSPGKQIGLHTQPGFEISYIITGRGTRILGTVTEPFEAGEVVLVPPGLPHQWQFNADCTDTGGCIENITFHFSQTFLDRLLSAFPELSADILRLKELTEAVSFKGKQRLPSLKRCGGWMPWKGESAFRNCSGWYCRCPDYGNPGPSVLYRPLVLRKKGWR